VSRIFTIDAHEGKNKSLQVEHM